jgi:sec-independent protein translocase protein TatA
MNLPLAFIEGIGGPEMMMIMFIVLLLFGANKMPELAKGLGKSVREFKKAASGVEDEVRRAMAEHEEPVPKKFPTHPPGATSQLPGTVQQATPAPTTATPLATPPPPPHTAD